ncbi:hypothetical protein P9481_25045, partial [Escherichia coli]
NIYILKILTIVGLVLAIFSVYPVDYLIQLLSLLPAGGYIEKIRWYSQDDYAGSVLTFSLVFKVFVVLLFDYRFKSIKSHGQS